MIEIGKMNVLRVSGTTKGGYVLRYRDLDIDVFLPQSAHSQDLNIGDELDAFVYVDNQDNPIASLEKPSAMVDEFAVMKVLETHQFGAFVDWGIQKDLLIPDTEQKEKVGLGRFYIVRVCLDERTNKVYGTTKIGKYIQHSKFDIAENDKVTVVPANKEELGYRCLINGKFVGMIYYNEIFQKINLGEPLSGYVKKIREDNLVDVSLQVLGFKNVLNSQDKILAHLEQKGGKSHLHDKSDPKEIMRVLNMSKKTFKSSIGMLYKDKKIIIHDDGIELVKSKS